MLLFAVAHGLHLQDGLYAVRSPEFPDCEARHARIEVAREQFAEVLRERLLKCSRAAKCRAFAFIPTRSSDRASPLAARCRFPRPIACRGASIG